MAAGFSGDFLRGLRRQHADIFQLEESYGRAERSRGGFRGGERDRGEYRGQWWGRGAGRAGRAYDEDKKRNESNRGRGKNGGRQFSQRGNYPTVHTPAPERTASVQDMRKLEELTDNEALLALLDQSTGLCNLFKLKPSDDTVELLVRVALKASSAFGAKQSVMKFLKTLCDIRFLENVVLGYLTMRIVMKSDDGEMALNVIKLCSLLMKVLPSFSSKATTLVLATMKQWIEILKLKSVGLDAIQAFEEAEESRNKIIGEKSRGEVMKDDELDEGNLTPPDDFRKIPTMPTLSEINSNEPPFLRKNIIHGAYKSVDHYLDVQYRLLREDFIAPLRQGIKALLSSKKQNIPLKKITDIRVYEKVHILMPYCTQKGIMYRASFDVSHMKRVRWESSKRLIFGSLVGLSRDGFRNIIFGTVADRKPVELEKGIVDLYFEDESSYALDPNPYVEYQMVESSAYFEAYRHVLEGLQEIPENGLPFSKYLLNQGADEVDMPRYLLHENVKYDLSVCIPKEKRDTEHSLSIRVRAGVRVKPSGWTSVPVLDLSSWPSADDLNLDKSQYTALQTALTKEFSVIQGPPGTGKTFIALKITQILLRNINSWMPAYGAQTPILVVCYTNHALDQFLEGILRLCSLSPGELIRIGGRSTSSNEQLLACSAHELRKNRNICGPSRNLVNNIRNAKNQMNLIEQQITKLSAEMNFVRQEIVHENCLQRYIHPRHARSLFNATIPWRGSVMPQWLKLHSAYRHQGFEVDRGDREERDSEQLKGLDEDVKMIESERQIDENAVTVQRREHLAHIQKVSDEMYKNLGLGEATFEEGEEEYETVKNKKSKKHVKQLIRKNVGNQVSMSEAEVRGINNVWRLSVRDRWRLYNYWVSLFCQERAAIIARYNQDFNQQANHLAELNREQDFVMLQNAAVIGMTTTGAAKYRSLIQRIQPKVVIVEEAAEVLESHIITTLSSGCEHLILIGDHQQLRPNPTVYKLAKEFHLDISLFERMVKNNIHCERLMIQHRMRPDIAALIVPHIYKELINHESVLQYPNISGINGNVFFVNHCFNEQDVEETKSRSNLHEAKYIAALVNYLVKQGYKPSQITVLTTYTGQMFLLRKTISKQSEKIRITPVDAYQGEENDIVLLSLVRSNEEGKIGFLQTHNRVCVALSRAKWGLFVIGNIQLLTEASSMWNSIARHLKSKSQLVDALPLFCRNHPDNIILAKVSEDFDKAPEGGCVLECGYRLDCGHACEKKCHPIDPTHEQHICRKPCGKILCDLDHRCPKLCYEACPDCMVLVEKIMPLCGHRQMVPCSMPVEVFACKEPCRKILGCGHECKEYCGSPCTLECKTIVEDRIWSPCYHVLSVECYLNPDNFPCTTLVTRYLPCGHEAEMLCSAKVNEYRCSTKVGVSLCGNSYHFSIIYCWKESDFKIQKCKFMVKKSCQVNSKHVFSVPCFEEASAKCPQRCNMMLDCEHRCAGKCGSCSSAGTHSSYQSNCQKILPCEHKCRGFCGSKCPPCEQKCTLGCEHGRCELACNRECRKCDLPCKWSCEHRKCKLQCYEPCVRKPCDRPCPRLVTCGRKHKCPGLCGEPCPPVCRICHKSTLDQTLALLEAPPLTNLTRFIFLQPCGCTVDVDSMDKWAELSRMTPPCEILPLTCPACHKMVTNCPRYNYRIKTYIQQVNQVKKLTGSNVHRLAMITSGMNSLWSNNLPPVTNELITWMDEEADKTWRRLSLGAICVYVECCNVSGLCARKNADISEALEMLEETKLKLCTNIEEKRNKDLAVNIVKLYQLFLLLHYSRLLTFIKNPHKIESLNSCIARLTRKEDFEAVVIRYGLNLSDEFTWYQKENIEDFIQHLDEYFDASIQLDEVKSIGMCCIKGHVFVCTKEQQRNVSTEYLPYLCLECHPEEMETDDLTQTAESFFDDVMEIEKPSPIRDLDALSRFSRDPRIRKLGAQRDSSVENSAKVARLTVVVADDYEDPVANDTNDLKMQNGTRDLDRPSRFGVDGTRDLDRPSRFRIDGARHLDALSRFSKDSRIRKLGAQRDSSVENSAKVARLTVVVADDYEGPVVNDTNDLKMQSGTRDLDRPSRFRVDGTRDLDRPSRFRVDGTRDLDRPSRFRIDGTRDLDRPSRFRVDGTGDLDRPSRFLVDCTRDFDRSSRFRVDGTRDLDRPSRFRVDGTRDLDRPSRFRVDGTGDLDRPSRFRVDGTRDLDRPSRFRVDGTRDLDRPSRFGVDGTRDLDRPSRFGVDGTRDLDRSSRFRVDGTRDLDQSSRFRVDGTRDLDRPSRFRVDGTRDLDRPSRFRIDGTRDLDRPSRFRVDGTGDLDRPSRFRVDGTRDLDRPSRFRVDGTGDLDRPSRFRVDGTRDLDRPSRFGVDGTRDLDRPSRFGVDGTRDLDRPSRFGVDGTRDLDRPSRFRVDGTRDLDRPSRFRVDGTRDLDEFSRIRREEGIREIRAQLNLL